MAPTRNTRSTTSIATESTDPKISSAFFRFQRELNALKRKGGKGGRSIEDSCSWDYFPTPKRCPFSNDLHTSQTNNVTPGVNGHDEYTIL